MLAALVKIANLPYRLSVFGVGTPVDPSKAVVAEKINPRYQKHPPIPVDMAPEHGETCLSDSIYIDSPRPQTERPNIEPPGNSSTKLFESTRIKIIEGLREGRQPHKDYAEAAKLLWTKGYLAFDGREYYL